MSERLHKTKLTKEASLQKNNLARVLFIDMGFSHKEIAEHVGVSEVTIGAWAEEGGWKLLRDSIRKGPKQVKSKIFEQLQNLHQKIELKGGVPDKDEAEVQQKLISSLDKLTTQNSPEQLANALNDFLDHVAIHASDIAPRVAAVVIDFINQKLVRE